MVLILGVDTLDDAGLGHGPQDLVQAFPVVIHRRSSRRRKE
jgi:hypothetical protein